MKKFIIFTMLLSFATASFGQQITPKQDWTETDYYKKSKKQKTTAWILLGCGVALFTGGLIAHYNYINNPDHILETITFKVTTGEVVAALGLLTAGGSIPLFIASSKNKKKAKAASVVINMEKVPVLQGTAFNNQLFPAVGVRIGL